MYKKNFVFSYIGDHAAMVPLGSFLFEFEIDQIPFPNSIPASLISGFGLSLSCSRKAQADGFVRVENQSRAIYTGARHPAPFVGRANIRSPRLNHSLNLSSFFLILSRTRNKNTCNQKS